jgi:hypothetical protein
VFAALRAEGMVVKVDPKGDEDLRSWTPRLSGRIAAMSKAKIYGRYRVAGHVLPFYSNAACELHFYTVRHGWYENRLAPKTYAAPPAVVETMQYGKPIDVVYTWVDGGDPDWLERKRAAQERTGDKLHPHSLDRSRFDSRDDLRYSIRSVVNYMPWVRNIFIVTDRQSPDWLQQTDRVRLVDHRDIFPSDATLPTFNSHAIESVLHRIEGLSEIFLYMNDDFFVRRPTRANTFVAPNGITSVFLSATHIPVGPVERRHKASEWGAMNASNALKERLGEGIAYLLRHAPYAISRSGMAAFEEEFAGVFAEVRKAQFRSNRDIAPISGYLHYAIWTGRAIPRDSAYGYVDLSSPSWRRQLRVMDDPAKAVFFCLNDAESEQSQSMLREQKDFIRQWLSKQYPSKVECEK